ncbi:MAG TPA: SRPBCC family protein [Chloroflexota bacterium]|jgi:phenylpropionate dioxygenase-like ring-hydroxylating dioxygenase large terminal subunit
MVSRAIFADEAIYRLELERVFGRCWLFLGHESLLPAPGDYVTNYMGEDAMIVCRDPAGRLGAFLNTCTHRGNKVCLFERGHATTFTCTYHGWSFDTAGRLCGVPHLEEAYYGRLDRERLGLVRVPRVESYGGLIFGCWDADAPSLDDYLGDVRWYLDRLYLVDDFGGLEVLPGRQSYVLPGNWKTPAENFAGDHYHTLVTHASSLRLGLAQRSYSASESHDQGPFEIALAPGHGLGGIYTGAGPFERDLRLAEELGAEAVDYVRERYRRQLERLRDVAAKPYGFSHGTIFPNLSLNGASSAFQGRGLFLWQPLGPLQTRVLQWCAVERQAPAVVKERAAEQYSRWFSGSGLFGQDDGENCERVMEATCTPRAQQVPFHYAMGLGCEGHWPGMAAWDVAELPGQVGPHFSEHTQRQYFGYWAALMARPEGAA